MSRLAIRVRVAAAFALAMAIVLAATGVLIYGRVGNDLATALDQDLRLRAQDISGLIDQRGASLAAESGTRLIESEKASPSYSATRGGCSTRRHRSAARRC